MKYVAILGLVFQYTLVTYTQIWLIQCSTYLWVNQFLCLWLEVFIMGERENVSCENYFKTMSKIVWRKILGTFCSLKGLYKVQISNEVIASTMLVGENECHLWPQCFYVFGSWHFETTPINRCHPYSEFLVPEFEFTPPDSLSLYLPYDTEDQWENGKIVFYLNTNLLTQLIQQIDQALICP